MAPPGERTNEVPCVPVDDVLYPQELCNQSAASPARRQGKAPKGPPTRNVLMLASFLRQVALSALILLLRNRRLGDSEFSEFFDSSAIADELFGDAFEEIPDKA